MQARDGLLVRLRITGGIVPAATARALATLGLRYGNGLFDLSARGNLQLRGVTEHTLFPLQNALRALNVIDDDIGAESVRNVVASPLASLHAGPDIRPIVRGLEARLSDTTRLHALPDKFGFLIDDGSIPSLASVGSDVRFDWDAPSATFAVGLGGTANDAVWIGRCATDDLVDWAERIADGALSLFARSRTARRMRTLLYEFGPNAVASVCGAKPTDQSSAKPARFSDFIVGPHDGAGLSVFGAAAPFGRLDHRMLAAVADLAAHSPRAEIRLTPWRCFLIPDVIPSVPERDRLAAAGFIVSPDDPRLTIAACTGREGCSSGSTLTHADALGLADLAARFATGNGPAVHVSGCQKGCACAAAAAVTLVGHDGRYDLVRNGRASDFPIGRSLDPSALRQEIEAILVTA